MTHLFLKRFFSWASNVALGASLTFSAPAHGFSNETFANGVRNNKFPNAPEIPSVRTGFEKAAVPKARNRKPDFLVSAMTALFSQKDVVIFTVDDHFDFRLQGPLRSKGFFEVAKESGVTDYFEELPKELQPFLDEFLSRKITKKEFLDSVLLIVGKAIDENFQDEERLTDAEYEKRLRAAHRIINHAADRFREADNAGLKVHLTDPHTYNDYVKIDKIGTWDAKLQRCFDHDADVAQAISRTKSGKAILFSGRMHTAIVTSHLDDGLSGNVDNALWELGETVGVVNLTASLNTQIRDYTRTEAKDITFLQGIALDRIKGYDVPDVIYSPVSKTGVLMEAKQVLWDDPKLAMQSSPKPARSLTVSSLSLRFVQGNPHPTLTLQAPNTMFPSFSRSPFHLEN